MVRSRLSRSPAVAAALGLLAAGCGDQPIAPKAIAGDVVLAPGAFALYTGRQAAGPIRFPATAGAAEYLMVAQFATAQADVGSSFTLEGAAGLAARVAPTASAAPLPAALRFHEAIRRMDESVARASFRLGPGARRAPRPRAGPPVVGSQRVFKVCGDLDCATTVSVTATAQIVGAHSAIYLDSATPAGGFTPSDLQQLSAQFDTVLYPIDSLAFGPPSDIDGNGVVIILLTPRVNAWSAAPTARPRSSPATSSPPTSRRRPVPPTTTGRCSTRWCRTPGAASRAPSPRAACGRWCRRRSSTSSST